jgi:glycerol-3-phosphate dehydrogenase
VVPRIDGADDAYLLQSPDGRVVFALPFEHRFTLIGTTEVGVSTPADGFVPSGEEEDYLLGVAERFFSRALTPDDVVWRFAGVRPLVEDGAARASAVSREYRLDLLQAEGSPPLLNVVGGKITTFRRLAEAALSRLAPFFPAMGAAWTEHAPLPGGAFGAGGFASHGDSLVLRHPRMARATLLRLASLYGTRAGNVLGEAATDADLGESIGGGLTAREVVYLRDHEWARTAQDVLWRRTKAGLHLDAAGLARAEAVITRLLDAP